MLHSPSMASSSSSSLTLLPPSSPSPSSSAVTIPIPGKSILKKPPPVQASLFSRLSRFLPAAAPTAAAAAAAAAEANGTAGGGGMDGNERVLRRAHFILPEIAVVYPISSLAPPSTPALKDEKRAIEDRERERRWRVVRANSNGGGTMGMGLGGSMDTASVSSVEEAEWWAMDKVESFYRECCEGCQESPDKGITLAFKNTPPTHPRSVDFSGVQLTFTSASILADVLSIEWGLRKAVFRECDLDEHTLKPILHALLIPRSLAYLSLAANRRLKGANAWRLVGAYVAKSHTLLFLDLSQNPLDKKAVEYIVAALTPAHPSASSSSSTAPSSPIVGASGHFNFNNIYATASTGNSMRGAGSGMSSPAASSPIVSSASSVMSVSDTASVDSREGFAKDRKDRKEQEKEGKDGKPGGLVSLKLDDCALRAGALEALSRAVRTSSLRNISLRHNRITPTGAVALALMIRDYPDVVNAPVHVPVPGTAPPSPIMPTPVHDGAAPRSPVHPASGIPLGPGGKPLPPPRHPTATLTTTQTTYTPYVPRRRQQSVPAPGPPPAVTVASSVLGGVTARHQNASVEKEQREREAAQREREREAHAQGPSAALLDKVRALDALPRVGALRTLDLRGNDLRNGITYIAQVLKRNRTLKVLNLAENKLDVACLVSLAEALKYNSSLETLDLSRNPCSGPGLEGIQSLRTAFTLNTALKRLFLSATGLGSPGAIALAEFLPESASLLHLDLTENALGVAGVLALSKGLEANFVMRCLDLNIPPGDEEFARMCRDILNACVRNTEQAERTAHLATGGGSSGTLTPVLNGAAGGDALMQANGSANGVSGSGRGLGKGVWGMIEESELAKSIRLDEEKKIENDIVVRACACVGQLEELLAPPSPSGIAAAAVTPASGDAVKQARALIRELGTTIQETEDPTRMEELLNVNDELTALVARAPPPGRPTLTLQSLGLKWAPGAAVASSASAGAVGNRDALQVNGHVGDAEEDHTPTTPRVDKGKAKAVPEPEEPEKVLSPTFMIAEEDDDEEDGRMRLSPVEEGDGEPGNVASPTDRSRSWVEEEGEVFRKGTILLGPEEMDGEYAGEDLRKELLEAMVERPPPRPLTDQFGMEILPHEEPQQQDPPASPQLASPAVDKPPPRPYISRSRSSSSSIMSIISPTVSSFTSAGQNIDSPASSPRIPPSPSPLGTGVRPYLPRSRSSSSALDNR